MIDLSVDFLGIKFKNPVAASSGAITFHPVNMRSCIEAGVGGITTKMFVFDPEKWDRPARRATYFLDKYEKPGCLAYSGYGFLSPERGIKYIEEIKPLAEKENVRVIANMDCTLPLEGEALVNLAQRIEAAGADMIELIIGCPQLVVASQRVAKTRESIEFVLKTLKGQISVPFFMKMGACHISIEIELLKMVEDLGGEGIHIFPGINGTWIDIESARPIIPNTTLYGRDTMWSGTYFTAVAATTTKLQIISSGGIWTWRDVVQRIMCGATITAIQTAVMYRGYKLFTDIVNNLTAFMERKDYKKIDDFRGIAAPYVDNYEVLSEWWKERRVPKESVKITIDPVKCNGCGKCLLCIQNAITIKAGVARIDLELCERCGACASICPTNAIII